MADDSKQRSYRSNDQYRRAAEPSRPDNSAPASDPLAELARLIGQSDPFAEFGRSNSRQASRQPAGDQYRQDDQAQWTRDSARDDRYAAPAYDERQSNPAWPSEAD